MIIDAVIDCRCSGLMRYTLLFASLELRAARDEVWRNSLETFWINRRHGVEGYTTRSDYETEGQRSFIDLEWLWRESAVNLSSGWWLTIFFGYNDIADRKRATAADLAERVSAVTRTSDHR